MRFPNPKRSFFVLLFVYIISSSAVAQDTLQNSEVNEPIFSFYLIGDTGYGKEKDSDSAIKALDQFLTEKADPENSFVIFLGDNLKDPDQLPWSGEMPGFQKFAEKIIFLPGEMEWNHGGIDGNEKRAENLLKIFGTEKEKEDDEEVENVFLPDPGCGFSFVDISDDVHLIVIDSQWFLEDWDDHPTINDDCPEIKTREAMLIEIESELKKNQEKTTIIAMHHPLVSKGVHGGKFGWTSYLEPAEENLMVPVVGQLTNLIRTSGGTSSQDVLNPHYNSFVDRLSTISQNWGRVIFAAGHDHSLQYNDNGLIKQIVSGSGGINAYVRDSENGFSSEEKGFAVLDIYKDGSSRVKFYAAEASQPELLHENLVYPAVDSLEFSDFPEEFPEFKTAAIYSEEETQKSDFYEFLWGERYRDLYSKEIKVPVADLTELYGGLEPMRLGGGHQTNSIRLKDSLDREYNIRMLRKDAVQFLQTTAYKDKVVEEAFKGTFAERMIQDFYTASHPYAYLAVAPLAEAAGVNHTNPEIYFLPHQPTLGEYNAAHGGEIYMIEERPEENWLGYESFGSPNHDIQSTAGMFDRLRRDEKYSVDEEAYVRARLFDMLVGDWDRHADQWRWAEIELDNGDRIFEPIPRDRDQAFSKFDGFLFENLRKIISFLNQFGDYDEDINDIEMFNRAANSMDRSLIQTSGKDIWVEQAEFLQNAITNGVIRKSFDTLPEAIQGESTEEIIENLKGRRRNLRDIALEYYEALSEVAWMTGTDKDDFIDIIRLGDGKTKISISRNKDGRRGKLMKEKIFNAEVTDEVWVYALDDDDQIFVKGAGTADIAIKIIGGQNNDVYNIENGNGIKIYDHRSKPNTIKSKNGAKVYLTDNYKINTFDPNFRISESGGILPYFGYNPDDGVILGISKTSTTTGLVRKPFTTQHKISAGYFFGTKGFEVAYSGEFAHPTHSYNLFVGAHYSSPHNSRNFFGYGNETLNYTEELGKDYNRTRISEYGAEIGLVRRGQYGSHFRYSIVGESVEVEETPGRFLDIAFPEVADFYDRMFFAGLQAEYSYESYDNYINPSKGLNFNVSTGGKMNIENPDKHFLFLNPYLELFTPLTTNHKLVLNPKMQAQINFLDGYEFYQAAILGGKTGLRSFRHERFSGKRAFSAGSDLRYTFDPLENNFLPLQIGIFAGYDTGRVWAENEDSGLWHQSYGGGFWLSIAKAGAAQFRLFHGDEGYRFSFGFRLGL